jgi:hypothetical protein
MKVIIDLSGMESDELCELADAAREELRERYRKLTLPKILPQLDSDSILELIEENPAVRSIEAEKISRYMLIAT